MINIHFTSVKYQVLAHHPPQRPCTEVLPQLAEEEGLRVAAVLPLRPLGGRWVTLSRCTGQWEGEREREREREREWEREREKEEINQERRE